MVLAKDYMKRKRFELPQWCGLMLSFNGNDYRIHSTSYVRAGDFVQVSIWAKRFKEIRRVRVAFDPSTIRHACLDVTIGWVE